jgi:hypothetical protein
MVSPDPRVPLSVPAPLEDSRAVDISSLMVAAFEGQETGPASREVTPIGVKLYVQAMASRLMRMSQVQQWMEQRPYRPGPHIRHARLPHRRADASP